MEWLSTLKLRLLLCLVFGSTIVGGVLVLVQQTPMHWPIRVLAVLVVLASVALILGIYIKRILLKPIARIARHVREIDSDTHERELRLFDQPPGRQQGNELVEVVIALNEMCVRLSPLLSRDQTGYENTVRRGQILEHRVEKRTLELEQALTEVKQTEQALEDKTTVLEAILENMDQGVFLVDADLRLVAYNQRLCELLSLPAAFLDTRPTSAEIVRYQIEHGEFQDDAPIEEQVKRWSAPLEGRTDYYAYERQRPNGTVLEARNIQMADGGWVRTFTDITERAQAAKELEKAMQVSEAASRSKSAFVANMSHEIRTPMNAVIGLTRMALDTELNPEQKEYLTKIQRASNSLLGIINAILDFSKIEAGKVTIEAVDFNLEETMEQLATVVELAAQEKRLTLNFRIAPEVAKQLRGDPLRLGQVLMNLTNNAIKFTEQGEVTVLCAVAMTELSKTRLRFSVRDTGIGMTAEQQAGLFKPFTQADNSTTREYGGTGLGLSISKELVDMMGGEIQIKSAFGQGTTVSFTLDFEVVTRASSTGVTTTGQADAPQRLEGIRVLLVEDNAINQQIARSVLERAGASVETVDDGLAALERVKTEQHDLDVVLMDLQMPRMDGYDATRAIRAFRNPQQLPIVAMTAHALDEERDRCSAAGMQGHVAKPIDVEQLIITINRLVPSKPMLVR